VKAGMVMENENLIKEKLRILQERRSIRKFQTRAVPKTVLLDIIRYATFAPSATNRQGWKFILITDSSLKQTLVDAGASVLINDAPYGILVVYEKTIRGIHYHDDYQSAAACIQNLLLAAQAYGLGACWICHLPPQSFIRKLLNIPPNYSPMAYILIGYPETSPVKSVPRKFSLEEIVFENQFSQVALTRSSRRIVWFERLLIWVYYRLPIWIRKIYVNKVVERKFTKQFDN
jgi:nitroreductase